MYFQGNTVGSVMSGDEEDNGRTEVVKKENCCKSFSNVIVSALERAFSGYVVALIQVL